MARTPLLSCLLALRVVAVPADAGEPIAFATESFSGIPFNFEPPGARSLGMGGSFIGLADDATASEANPAGLTILTQPEVSLHARQAHFDVAALDLNAELLADSVDSTADPTADFTASVSSLSFASFVQPLKRRDWVLSLYYLQSTNFEGEDKWAVDTARGRYSSRREIDFVLSNVGISAAYRFGDRLSVGGSIRRSRLSLRGRETVELGSGEGSVTLRNIRDDADAAFTFNLGVMIRPMEKLSFGLVVKDGGEYDIDSVSSCFAEPPATCSREQSRFGSVVEIPDFIGAGLALRPMERLTLLVDVDFITYSTLPVSRGRAGTEPAVEVLEPIDDEFEVHFGAEYVFPGKHVPVAVRAGAFTDPDHDGSKRLKTDQAHYTVGAGIVVRDHCQVDVALHSADSVTEGVVSVIYRF